MNPNRHRKRRRRRALEVVLNMKRTWLRAWPELSAFVTPRPQKREWRDATNALEQMRVADAVFLTRDQIGDWFTRFAENIDARVANGAKPTRQLMKHINFGVGGASLARYARQPPLPSGERTWGKARGAR